MRIMDWSSDVCSSDLPGQTEALGEFVARLTEKRESVRRIVFRDREPTARFDDPYFVIALFVEIEGSDDPAQLVCIIVEQLDLLREAARAFEKLDIAEEEVGRVDIERLDDLALAQRSDRADRDRTTRSEEHTSELQSLIRT